MRLLSIGWLRPPADASPRLLFVHHGDILFPLPYNPALQSPAQVPHLGIKSLGCTDKGLGFRGSKGNLPPMKGYGALPCQFGLVFAAFDREMSVEYK